MNKNQQEIKEMLVDIVSNIIYFSKSYDPSFVMGGVLYKVEKIDYDNHGILMSRYTIVGNDDRPIGWLEMAVI